MLPAHIVSQILKRERKSRDQLFEQQPVIEMPSILPPQPADKTLEEKNRGVVIIDL